MQRPLFSVSQEKEIRLRWQGMGPGKPRRPKRKTDRKPAWLRPVHKSHNKSACNLLLVIFSGFGNVGLMSGFGDGLHKGLSTCRS